MARILGVGIASLDIINQIDGFPAEDSEVRALEQQQRRGGNATNTLVVLSRLGYQVEWAGAYVDAPASIGILEDLRHHQVGISACRVDAEGVMPTSYISLNRENGSRTIVHHRQLDEYTFEDFKRIDFSLFDWLHFEGRNIPELLKMLALCEELYPGLPRSVEVEKLRPGIEAVFPMATQLIFSRSAVQAQGYDKPRAFFDALHRQHPNNEKFCAWGSGGAYAMSREGEHYYAPAIEVRRVVDSIGAGDTFNAAVIDALLRGHPLQQVIEQANALAGKKCGYLGFDFPLDQFKHRKGARKQRIEVELRNARKSTAK